MVGREDQGEIETQEGLMRDGEQYGARQTQKVSEHSEVADRVKNQQAGFQDGMCDFRTQEEANAVVFQDEGLEQRQREERKVLVFHGEARQTVFAGDLVFGECERN